MNHLKKFGAAMGIAAISAITACGAVEIEPDHQYGDAGELATALSANTPLNECGAEHSELNTYSEVTCESGWSVMVWDDESSAIGDLFRSSYGEPLLVSDYWAIQGLSENALRSISEDFGGELIVD